MIKDGNVVSNFNATIQKASENIIDYTLVYNLIKNKAIFIHHRVFLPTHCKLGTKE